MTATGELIIPRPTEATRGFLHFDAGTHTYTEGGEVLLSVTTALKMAGIIDYSMIPQDVLQKASRRGTAVHNAIHFYLDGDLDESTVPDVHRGYLDAAKRFLEESQFTPMRVECRNYHQTHRYAGTYDLDGILAGKDLATVDWKTGIVMPGHAFQLAAYNALERNPRERRRLAVQLRADSTYRVHEFPSPEYREHTYTHDISIFLAALQCARWNGGK
jgi:hypothetical protein